MTTQKKVSSRKSANETEHRRAMANPMVLELLSNLGRDWAAMAPLDRGVRLRELTALGCSARGLEKALQQSATSIRRHMATAGQPKMYPNADELLAAAQEAANQRAKAERDECQRQRVIEDAETGALSDEVATVFLRFCRAEDGLLESPILQGGVPLLLRIAERNLSEFEARGRQAIRIPEEMDLKELFRLTEPSAEGRHLRMKHCGGWIANVVWAMAPERPIRESALRKSKSRAGELTPKKQPMKSESRVRELTPRKQPIEIWLENQRQSAENSASHAGQQNEATRCLERQGKPTRS